MAKAYTNRWRTIVTKNKIDPPAAPAIGPDSDAYPHPGAMIRDELKTAGFSIPKAAVAMALNRANLNNVVLGKAALSRDLAYRLSALLNRDDETFGLAKLLIDLQAQHDWGRDAPLRKTIQVMVDASRAHAAKVD